jgi:hypothetical protein
LEQCQDIQQTVGRKMNVNASVFIVALLITLFSIANPFQPPKVERFSDLPEPNAKYINAIPIQKKDAANDFDDETIRRSAFCESGIDGLPNTKLDGVRITAKHAIAFISDQKIEANERIEKDELDLILAWVSYRVALHNYIVDGKKSEDESNDQHPVEFHKNEFSDKLKRLPSGF